MFFSRPTGRLGGPDCAQQCYNIWLQIAIHLSQCKACCSADIPTEELKVVNDNFIPVNSVASLIIHSHSQRFLLHGYDTKIFTIILISLGRNWKVNGCNDIYSIYFKFCFL
jgi:hypothetical protein